MTRRVSIVVVAIVVIGTLILGAFRAITPRWAESEVPLQNAAVASSKLGSPVGVDRPGKGTGLKRVDPDTYKKLPRGASLYSGAVPAMWDITSQFQKSGDQQDQDSCVAWAIAHGVLTYRDHVRSGSNLNDPAHQYSPSFIFNLLKNGTCTGGIEIPDALDLTKDTGSLPVSVFKCDVTKCTPAPSGAERAMASRQRIEKWITLPAKNVQRLKESIYAGRPVILGIPIDQAFTDLPRGSVWDPNWAEFAWVGDHAVVLTGYSPNSFKMYNSWGTDWADNGIGLISVAALQRIPDATWAEAYCIVDRSYGQGIEQLKSTTIMLEVTLASYQFTELGRKTEGGRIAITSDRPARDGGPLLSARVLSVGGRQNSEIGTVLEQELPRLSYSLGRQSVGASFETILLDGADVQSIGIEIRIGGQMVSLNPQNRGDIGRSATCDIVVRPNGGQQPCRMILAGEDGDFGSCELEVVAVCRLL